MGGDHLDRREDRLFVDEAFLAAAMDLAHRQAAVLEPAPVDFAELGVPVAVRMLLEIFEMEQLERDGGLAPLGMQVGAVGNGPMMRGCLPRVIAPARRNTAAAPAGADGRPRGRRLVTRPADCRAFLTKL